MCMNMHTLCFLRTIPHTLPPKVCMYILCMYVYLCGCIFYMYVYIYMYVCVFIYVCIHIYVCMYVCMYVCVFIYVCIHIYVCMYMYVCMYACMHVFIYMYVCMYLYARMYLYACWKGTSPDKIYDELGWESLADHRWCRRLFHFYKIQNNLTPPYLEDPIPPIRSHLFGSRSVNVINEIRCKSKSYSNSFYPDTHGGQIRTANYPRKSWAAATRRFDLRPLCLV